MRIRDQHQAQTRILVADRDRLDALTLSAIIHSVGYEVATAFSGEEVLARAASFGPDLLVTEVSLGQLTGIEAAAQIAQKLPDCRVLFLSGDAPSSEITNAAPEGPVYAFKSKPVHPLNLLNAIAEILSTNGRSDDTAGIIAHDGALQPQLAKIAAAQTGFDVRETESAADRAV